VSVEAGNSSVCGSRKQQCLWETTVPAAAENVRIYGGRRQQCLWRQVTSNEKDTNHGNLVRQYRKAKLVICIDALFDDYKLPDGSFDVTQPRHTS